MESYIVKSFVKGIFKTSGGLLVLGIGIFIYENVNKMLTKKTKETKETKETFTETKETEEIGNGISIGVNSNGDVEVYKTDKDDTGQLYVRGNIFKACGKLNKDKKTETQETENDKIQQKPKKENQIVDKDFKKLFTLI